MAHAGLCATASRLHARRNGEQMITRQLFATHPKPAMDAEALRLCIAACFDAAAATSACADACLAERDVAALIRCIRTCLDCSDLCVATGRMLSRQAELS